MLSKVPSLCYALGWQHIHDQVQQMVVCVMCTSRIQRTVSVVLLEKAVGEDAVSSDAVLEHWNVYTAVLAGWRMQCRSNSPFGSDVWE